MLTWPHSRCLDVNMNCVETYFNIHKNCLNCILSLEVIEVQVVKVWIT